MTEERPTLVNGYDATFWYESYHMVTEAILKHLDGCVRDDDVAEEAIFVEAIETAGQRLARAEAAEDYVTRLQIDKDSLNAEVERYKELLDAAIEDYNCEKQRAEAAEQQLQALQDDAEWRNRWHTRLGRGLVEPEGKFYERLASLTQPGAVGQE